MSREICGNLRKNSRLLVTHYISIKIGSVTYRCSPVAGPAPEIPRVVTQIAPFCICLWQSIL